MDDFALTIEIPPDSDGFIPMGMPSLRRAVWATAEDIEDDEVLEIRCPHCGITSESYVTPEIIELAEKKLANLALGLIHDEMKKLERTTKGKAIEVKVGRKLYEEAEPILAAEVNSLQEAQCDNCGR